MSTPTAVVSFHQGRCKRGGVAATAEQLDPFAELEAAEMRRRLDCAPTLFDTEQRGYFARVVLPPEGEQLWRFNLLSSTTPSRP